MQKDILSQAGLNENEIEIYRFLLQNGEKSPTDIIKNTSLKRGTAYNVLTSLEEKGLIERFIKNKKAHFRLVHPSAIKDYVDQKAQELHNTEKKLVSVLPGFISQYNLVLKKPATHFLEGPAGLEKVYEDIINEKKDVLLIRSVLDNNHPEIDFLVQKQIKKQIRNNIKTRAITPLVEDTPYTVIEKDAMHLVERRIVPKEKLLLPAQVIIYSNKVAITSFEDTLVTTLIENEAISLTFHTIFEYFWELATPTHDKIYQNIMSRKQ